jgi:RNA recognition motif. (a.k.a. RRM, RBD, or RNP domain)
MSTFEKRAREEQRDEKARAKMARRHDKRNAPPSRGPQITTQAEIIGNVRSIDEVMAGLLSGARVERSAPPLPVKLFVGSLHDTTTSGGLRAHFERYGAIAEAAVITDRGSGASRNFGFVTMVDRKDAPRAIAALHHSELDGNRIVVSVATDPRG